MVVATDVTVKLLLLVIEERAIAGGGGGRTIEPDDEIVWCNKFEEFCCCRFENIVDGLVSLTKIKQKCEWLIYIYKIILYNTKYTYIFLINQLRIIFFNR